MYAEIENQQPTPPTPIESLPPLIFSFLNMDDMECSCMYVGDTTDKLWGAMYDFTTNQFSDIVEGEYDEPFTQYSGSAMSGDKGEQLFCIVKSKTPSSLTDVVVWGMAFERDTEPALHDFVRKSEIGGSMVGKQYDDGNSYLDVNVDNDTIVFSDSEATNLQTFATTTIAPSVNHTGHIDVSGELPDDGVIYLQLNTSNEGQAGDGRAFLNIIDINSPTHEAVGTYGWVPLGVYEVRIPPFVKEYIFDKNHAFQIFNHDTIEATTPLSINSMSLVYYRNSESQVRTGSNLINNLKILVEKLPIPSDASATWGDWIPEKYRDPRKYDLELHTYGTGEDVYFNCKSLVGNIVFWEMSSMMSTFTTASPDINKSLLSIGYQLTTANYQINATTLTTRLIPTDDEYGTNIIKGDGTIYTLAGNDTLLIYKKAGAEL